MKQHLFFSTTLNEDKIRFCNTKIKSESKLIYEINANPGTLFLFDECTNVFSKRTITTVRISNKLDNQPRPSEGSDFIYIKTKNVNLKVFVQDPITIDENELKLLYAKSNQAMVGIYSYSLFYTFKKRLFKYARPVVAHEVITSELVPYILDDYYIIPEKDNRENTLYGEVIEENGQYIITLTNDKMIKFDRRYLNGELGVKKNFYRPYFYEFFVDEKYPKSELESKLGTIYKVSLSTEIDKKKPEDKLNKILGELFFSASPAVQLVAHLEFLDKANVEQLAAIEDLDKESKNGIKIVEDKDVIEKKFLEQIPRSYIPLLIDIYHVGQGNWIKIRLASENDPNQEMQPFDIVFDVGRSQKINGLEIHNLNAKLAAEKLAEHSMFVLSHWDLDHILGLIHLKKSKLEVPWTVPQLPKSGVSRSAQRLAIFLATNQKIDDLFISEKLNGQNIFDSDYFKLGKGMGNNIGKRIGQFKTKYNNKNNLGLILVIKDLRHNKKILLPGDCEYMQFPSCFLDEYNFMVVSHHGAETTIDGIGFPPSTLDKKKAIATVNAAISYKKGKAYPKDSHVCGLCRLGYCVSTTELEGNWSCKIKDL